MPATVRYMTDPACSESWTIEPAVRKLMAEFGGELRWTFVMGGLARDYRKGGEGLRFELMAHWLDAAEESGMPFDPRLWSEGPIDSSYPACMAVKAAAEQADDGGYAYLRALREGLMCLRRKLDTTEALVEEARRVRLDVERFRIDLGSHAIVEAFGADLDEVRDPPEEARAAGAVVGEPGRERVSFPSMVFVGEDGSRHGAWGSRSYADYRAAAEAAGARPSGDGAPEILAALERFGRMATPEVMAVCDLPEPRAAAELWRLAAEWRVRRVAAVSGELWEPA